MRLAILPLVLLSGLIAATSAQNGSQSGCCAMSESEFRNLAESLPQLPGRIEAIRLFSAHGNQQVSSVAFATFDKQAGWQVLIFDAPSGHKFQMEWQSGKLDDSLSVSDADALKIFHFRKEDAVEFDGCASHVCPDVFSILLYVPSQRRAFVAKYVWGKVTYSPALDSPTEAQYKSALDQLVREHRDR